ncbi:glycosyltransferase family 2 protein [Geoglobus acetivorans]|uniref:Glycosyl transferase family 2 n=1 Tax=Geoglobus acetivorans TaxID=565033 RepID=A0A0A7GGV7_GEOAI|nr:glycosyl transferase family 2 [Geoglobus acetivorans]
MNHPRVSIIILNWNGWKDTVECLESLYRIDYPNYDVIVVDNGSEDDSVQKIREYAEGKIEVSSKFFEYSPGNKPIRVFEISEEEAREGKFNRPVYEKYDVDRRMILIRNNNNYGFAGGNNVGIKFALSVFDSDYVLLLNNDTVVDPGFLRELVKVADSDGKIGIAGPKVYYYENPSMIESMGGKINLYTISTSLIGNKEIDAGQHNKIIDVDWVSGCCLLFKKSVIYTIGLLNPAYFLYFEETDFCFRAKKKTRLVAVPESRIWHKSASTTTRFTGLGRYYTTRNRIKFARKNLNSIKLSIFMTYFILIFFPAVLAWLTIIRKDRVLIMVFLKSIKDGIFDIDDFAYLLNTK